MERAGEALDRIGPLLLWRIKTRCYDRGVDVVSVGKDSGGRVGTEAMTEEDKW